MLLGAGAVTAATRDIDPDTVREQYQINELVDVVKNGLIGEKNLSDNTYAACMNSFGHEAFCKCLSRELPANQSFDSYIFFMTTPMERLNYEKLKGDDKELVDSAHRARRVCGNKLE